MAGPKVPRNGAVVNLDAPPRNPQHQYFGEVLWDKIIETLKFLHLHDFGEES